MVDGMEKFIYARVPDHVHDYVTREAAAAGLSMAAYMRRLILAVMGQQDSPEPYHWQLADCPGHPVDGDPNTCTHMHVPGFLYRHETPDGVYAKLNGSNDE
jgi:hypothetical protein